MMTSLTARLPIDLTNLRAPAPSRREGSTSFADDLSSASEALAPSAPSPSPAPGRAGAPAPADQRVQRREERRDERGDAQDEHRDMPREDVAGAARDDGHHGARDERRDARRTDRHDDRRDERRAALDRARAASARAKARAGTEAAASGDAKATGERIADTPHDTRASGSDAQTAPLEPAPALPATTHIAARADVAAPAEAHHVHTLDALRQHAAATRGSDAGSARDKAQVRQGETSADAARVQGDDADVVDAATARGHDMRASTRSAHARSATVDGSPTQDPANAAMEATAAATAVGEAAVAPRADAATAMLDAMRPATRSEALSRLRGAVRGNGDASDGESASSRRVEGDALALAADAGRAATDTSTRADAALAWREAFTMPAPPTSIGAAPAAPFGSAGAVAGSAGAPPSSAAAEHTIAAAPGSAEFTRALSSQVTLWARDGTQEARLQLNPAELGPVTVFIAIDGAQARVDFHAHAAATRDAIEASLPSLAGALGEQGLELSGGGVFDRPGREASAQGQGQGQPQTRPSSSASRDSGHDADIARGLSMSARHVASRGLVDLVA